MKQKLRYSKYLMPLLILGDFIVVNLTFGVLFFALRSYLDTGIVENVCLLFLLLNLSYLPTRAFVKLTVQQNILFADEIIRRTFYHTLIHLILFLAALTAFQIADLSRFFILLTFSVQFITLSTWRVTFRFALRRYRRKGLNYKNVVILGTGKNAMALYQEMTGDKGYGYSVLGFFNGRSNAKPLILSDIRILGQLEDALHYITVNQVDEVYCAYPDSKHERIREIVAYCENNLIRFYMVPGLRNIVPKQYELTTIGVVPVLSLHQEPLQAWYNRFAKRTFDIVFSIFALVCILFPVILLVAPLIKMTSSGPIFFRQRRNGEQGRVFWCYKFRSMVVNKDSDRLQTVRNDPRKTWIGNIMRKTSIDELPQFYNVLRGDMSVVGPRPHMLEHTRIYSELIDKYMLRHLVKPGITGWAQIHGLRGEIQDSDFMRRRVEADVWYIEHWSFFLDVKIIYKTLIDAIRVDKHAI